MEIFADILSTLQKQPVLTLFLIIGMGYLIGNLRLGSFSLGPVAGVLFVGLFFGHFDFQMSAGAQAVGFALFIFSVGYQAGPRFFDVLRTDGLRYLTLAVVIAVTGFTVATLATHHLEFEPGTSAGLLAGGLTSSPTLAAAQEAVRDGTIAPPEGWTADQMVGNIATGYAITYIFGLAGLIAIIKLLPGILHIDLRQEAKRVEGPQADANADIFSSISTRAFRVTNEDFTKIPKDELRKKYWDGFSVARVRRDGKIKSLEPEEHLRLGDEVLIMGNVERFMGGIQSLGEEITGEVDFSGVHDTAQVVITRPNAVGKTLRELNIADQFGVLLLHVRRMRMNVPRSQNLILKKGDVLTIIGPASNIDLLGKAFGHVERDVAATDMVTFAFGIAAGVLLGMFAINIGGLSIGLGSAGGLLAAGPIIGFLRSVRPTFGRLPDATRWIFMEFGLLLFMTGVGLRAGGNIVETFVQAGPKLIIAGILVTVTPVMVGYMFGRKVLKINPVLLLGAITGAMTSGASLSIVTNAADSDTPALGYTGTYAFANVLLTVAGSIILFI
jgi:putative transport protein